MIFVDGPPQGQGCGTEGGKSLNPLLRRRIAPPSRHGAAAHLRERSAPHVPERGTTGAFYPLFRSPRPINRDVRRTCDFPRAPEAKRPNLGAGVRFFDTPETAKPFYRALRGTSPVSGVRPRRAPASKMEETDPGVHPHIGPRPERAQNGCGGRWVNLAVERKCLSISNLSVSTVRFGAPLESSSR